MVDLLKEGFISENGVVNKTNEYEILRAERKSENDEDIVFILKEEFLAEEYLVMEYECQGIRRKLLENAPLMYFITQDGEECAVRYDDISMDSKKHSIIVKTSGKEYKGIKICFNIDRRKSAYIKIYCLYITSKENLPVCLDSLITKSGSDYEKIDIKEKFNASFSPLKESNVIDGGVFFKDENVFVDEIPFIVCPDGKNIIKPDAPPVENNEMIENFGVLSKRRLCRPVSRDSKTEIIIDKKVSEIYFLMCISGKRHQRWGFATDGPILGNYCPDVNMPIRVDDVERFVVEIVYEDGRTDTALPLNVSLKRHCISGDVNLYAVAADGGKVKSVILHNRMLDTDVSLAAITVNTTTERKFPELLIPEKEEKIKRQISNSKSITLKDNILSIKNCAVEFVFDIKDGFKLVKLKNEYTPDFNICEDYFLKIRKADGTTLERFNFTGVEIFENEAYITYKYEKVCFVVAVENTAQNGVKFALKVKNEGEEIFKSGILFPSISKMEYKTREDEWYFFPKYQNINSNETVYIYEESAPSFPMQFFDVYSPQQQGGVAFNTEEKELVVRKYALEKDGKGIDAYIEYPCMYGEILPGEEFNTTKTLISAHEGDWKKAFEIYLNWLKTWYKPYKCQNKKWYRESFWLLAEIIDFFETEEFCDLPVWYDKEKKEFKLEKILEEQKSITGVYPDILHLWSWAYKKEKDHFTQQWGNFGSTDYEEYGGREAFKKALHDVRDKGVNVSLYLHPTLLSGRYPQAEKYFPNHRVINSNGEFICIEGDSYRMCHANDEWRDYAVSMYPRIYKELEIPLLYVDEFSLRIENRCYCDSHGHKVPSNLLKTDRDFITELKNAMPEEVVLYGEYYAVDVNARYIDCNISYYIIDSVVDMVETAWRADDGNDRLGRVFTDVYRFAFPGIVQLILPMAMRNMSWHPQKFLFFNGEAIYDSFWDCEESRGLDFTVKAYKLKKKYKDCFSSDEVETIIDTQSPAICANCFRGKGRTVYTLYNRAYNTYRGEALKIKHIDGTVYFDAWNDKEASVEIKDGFAYISVNIDAQEIGCIEVKPPEK